MKRGWRQEMMRPTMHRDFFDEMDIEGSSMAMPMYVDYDSDHTDMLDDFGHGEGAFSPAKKPPKDPKFFNRFEDDFDDSDIN